MRRLVGHLQQTTDQQSSDSESNFGCVRLNITSISSNSIYIQLSFWTVSKFWSYKPFVCLQPVYFSFSPLVHFFLILFFFIQFDHKNISPLILDVKGITVVLKLLSIIWFPIWYLVWTLMLIELRESHVFDWWVRYSKMDTQSEPLR